jgi:hypothetical protein
MPYVKRRVYRKVRKSSYGPRQYANSYAPRSRHSGAPRLSSSTRKTLQLSRYNLDRKPLMFADADLAFTLTVSGADGIKKLQPLYDFVNSTFYTTYVGPMYNQYRLKRVEYTVTNATWGMLPNGSETYAEILTSFPVQFITAWDRSDPYGNTTALSFANCANYPDRKITVLDGTKQFIHRQAITAQSYGQESEWLSTDAAPAVAPNTMGFFNPALYVAAHAGDANVTPYAALSFAVYVKYVIEVRGSKVIG